MSMKETGGSYLAVIKVVGVGGGGTNAVNRMVDSGLRGVEFIAVNTDAQALLMTDADVKIAVGQKVTRGLGAGANPEVGPRGRDREPRPAQGSAQGRGHGVRHRGRGRRHRNGRRARDRRARARARVRSPSASSRGRSASRARSAPEQAELGIEELSAKVDTLLVIPNDRLLQVVSPSTPIMEAFRVADDVLRQGVQGITDLITVPGLINLDFADVRTVMRNTGTALMGIGAAAGENRAAEAARAAISSPLLEIERRGRARHAAQHHRPERPRPVRGRRGRQDRAGRGRSERQHHLRRRRRRRHGRARARDRDRDRLRARRAHGDAPRAPERARGTGGSQLFDVPSDILDVPSFLRED